MQAEALRAYAAPHSDDMVSWFLKEAKAPLRMEERRVGAHSYFLCISGVTVWGKFIPVCGRGTTKLQAATRCIGEYLERKAVFDFFRTTTSEVRASSVAVEGTGEYRISNEQIKTALLPKEFWTTNGWAVHTDPKVSFQNALDEALERSLLMASFLRWGWLGFIRIAETSVEDFHFTSCLSRYKTPNYSAGFAIGQKDSFEGASFGHFCDANAQIKQSPKWAHALYESADKWLMRGVASAAHDPIAEDVAWYLLNKTTMDISDDLSTQEEIYFSQCSVIQQDLSAMWSLPFPLYSSFVFGGDLMPLFLPRELTPMGSAYVKSLSASQGFELKWPERVPVL